MGNPYVLGKFRPRMTYYALSLEDACKILDYYVSNYDSDKFSEAGVFEQFNVRMVADIDGDECRTEFTGTYSVQFIGRKHSGLAAIKWQTWEGTLDQLENLHKLIKNELGIE